MSISSLVVRHYGRELYGPIYLGRCTGLAWYAFLVTITAFMFVAGTAEAQSSLPESGYRWVKDWPALPKSMNGGKWGEVPGMDVGPDGNIWVIHRCFGRAEWCRHLYRSGQIFSHSGIR